MNIGYYPGCSLSGTAKEFDVSLREVVKALGLELKEIDDWCCCGASSAHALNHLLSVALPARNLNLAKKQGFEQVFAPCAACYSRLLVSQHELNEDNELKNKVEKVLEEECSNGLEVLNILDFFKNIGYDTIKSKIKMDLSGINVACYYGCLLVRPSGLCPDDTEQPTMMEEIVAATGANPVQWNFKTECCGAAHSIAHTGIVENLSKKIIDNALAHKADVIVVGCPMCHSNLDMRQVNIRKHFEGHKEIPVLYITELLGLAMGIDYKKLLVDLHYINTHPVLQKIRTQSTKEVTV